MLEAVRDWPKFRGGTEAELSAWLRQILAHVLLHEVRRFGGAQKRDIGREVSLDQALAESSRQLGNALAAPGSSPSERAGRHELELRLADAMARLPADYAEVILLRNIDGLSHDEIARRMGRGSGAAECSGCGRWCDCGRSSNWRKSRRGKRKVSSSRLGGRAPSRTESRPHSRGACRLYSFGFDVEFHRLAVHGVKRR